MLQNPQRALFGYEQEKKRENKKQLNLVVSVPFMLLKNESK